MLKQRIITGLLLAALVATVVYWAPTQYFALAALVFVVGLAGWEWAALTEKAGVVRCLLMLLPTAIICIILYMAHFADLQNPILPSFLLYYSFLVPVLLFGVAVWAVLVRWLWVYQPGTQQYQDKPYLLKIVSVPVLAAAWYALLYLHGVHYGYVFYIIALVAIADIGAYFSGKRFGKTKLAAKLSPGKTREGVYGALGLTLLWAILGAAVSGQSGFTFMLFILFSMLAVVMSVLGDLFESLIKREAGAKDSGTLLPGHGGVFDRIDGLLAALPVFTLGLLWIKAG